jgi:ribosomal protein S18 acetylase RimI-like enzyme
MNPNNLQSPRIRPVLSRDRAAALDLIFSRLPADERGRHIAALESSSKDDELFWEGLLGAYRDGQLAGSVFFQILPGKSAQVWLPCLVENEAEDTAIELIRAAVASLERCRVQMAQIILDCVGAEDEKILRKGGFAYLADLLYLACPEDNFPKPPLVSPLEFEAYTTQYLDRMKQIVGATYQATLDCPNLNNVRPLDDILEGYRAAGVFSENLWLFVKYENCDVGCLLLADHPQFENMELAYMGVMPSFRGRGWGADIARHAQWIAGRAGRRRLVLAVDASNRPAVAMYAAAGFQTWDRRLVYYRIF